MEQQKLHKNLRHVGAGVVTRPGDISSDDESDDQVLFDPLIVVRSSDEGRMMKKWLQTVREKLGGNFPRGSAVNQTERHLKRLKHQSKLIPEVADGGDSKDLEESQSWGNVDVNERGEFIIKQ